MKFELKLDEPTTFLNERNNPVKGHHLTFELEDGTMVYLDVSRNVYLDQDKVLALVNEQIDAHERLLGLGA